MFATGTAEFGPTCKPLMGYSASVNVDEQVTLSMKEKSE